MPELPELELLKREVIQQVVGKKVSHLSAKRGSPADMPGGHLVPLLSGAMVTGAQRLGKMLTLEFDSGLNLVIHQRLIGFTLLVKAGEPPTKEPSLAIHFTDGDRLEMYAMALRYQSLIKQEDLPKLSLIAKLGPDPMDPDFTLEDLRQALVGRRGPVKHVLMDQEVIAGLGNTYADEILFVARVHPERDTSALDDSGVKALYHAMRPELERAISLGGSSAEQYLHLDGSPGHIQEHFWVHRREGEPCRVCGTPIVRTEIGGRGAFYCPQCQPKG